MKISLASANPAMVSIFKDPRQMITLDANFIIPPYRRAAKIISECCIDINII